MAIRWTGAKKTEPISTREEKSSLISRGKSSADVARDYKGKDKKEGNLPRTRNPFTGETHSDDKTYRYYKRVLV